MRQKTGNTGIAQRIGKGTVARTAGQKPVRKQRAGRKAPVAFFADSLASLRLTVIEGAIVFQAQETIENRNGMEEGSFADMVFNLVKIHQKMADGLGINIENEKERPLVDQLIFAMDGIKKLLPEPFGFNIDHSTADGHYITVYAECRCQEQWNMIELGNLVKKLKKNSPKFHDFFLLFIRSFARSNSLPFWWQAEYAYTLENMTEQYSEACECAKENNINDGFEQRGMDKKEWEKEILLYKAGKANDYKNLIHASEWLSADKLLKQLATFKRPPKGLDKLVRIGCEMMTGTDIDDFSYIPDNEDDHYFRYESQHAIIWDSMSLTNACHEDLMDAEANEGVQPPIWHLKITKGFDGTIDFEQWKSCWGYPEKLRIFFDNAYQIIKEYTT